MLLTVITPMCFLPEIKRYILSFFHRRKRPTFSIIGELKIPSFRYSERQTTVPQGILPQVSLLTVRINGVFEGKENSMCERGNCELDSVSGIKGGSTVSIQQGQLVQVQTESEKEKHRRKHS